MSSARQSASRAPAPTGALMSANERRLRKYVRVAIAYTIPAFFLQLLLVKLGGAALWMPQEWRALLLVVGLPFGQACFSWARHDPRVAEVPEADGDGEQRSADQLSAMRRAERRKVREREAVQQAQAMRRRKSGVIWFGACILFLVPHVFLRLHCVEWGTIPKDVVASLDLHSLEELPWYIDMKYVGSAPTGVLNAADNSPAGVSIMDGPPRRALTGSVLVPLWLHDPDNQLLVRERSATKHSNVIHDYLENAPTSLVALLSKEHLSFAVTVTLFALVHFGILAAASIGYARTFSIPEELGSGVVDVIERVFKFH